MDFEDAAILTSEQNSELPFEQLDSEQFTSEEIHQQVRQYISAAVQRQCDRVRVLGMARSFKLQDIYTAQNFLTQIPCQRRSSIEALVEQDNSPTYKNWQLPTTPTLGIVSQHSKIAILGRLGSGKTTLLKHLALACISGDFCPDRVPAFVSLRGFAEELTKGFANSSYNEFGGISLQVPLAQYIARQLANYGAEDSQAIEYLLRQGQLLLLCDELDEVSDVARQGVLDQIRILADRFPQHQWAIATRSPNHVYSLEQFTLFELAEFNFFEVYKFASQWFKAFGDKGSIKLDRFAWAIEQNPILKELACFPLFLAQICLIFQSTTELDRLTFYREILDILLKDWEAAKSIAHNQIPVTDSFNYPSTHPRLSEKKALLGHLAVTSLERPASLWKRDELEQEIRFFCARANLAPTVEPSDWIEILKTQHGAIAEIAKGIFAFADRALQAVLAADKIAASNNPAAFKYLMQRIGDRSGNDAIVLAICSVKNPEAHLRTIYNYVESLVVNAQKIQEFLAWVNKQVLYLRTPFKNVAIKALYLDFDLENVRTLDRARALDIAHSRSLERAQMRALQMEGESYTNTGMDIDQTVTLALNLDLALFFASQPVLQLASALEPEFGKALAKLRRRLPNPNGDREKFALWWQANGLEWSKRFRDIMIQHRKGTQDWVFTDKELALLRKYHEANKLLVDCLNACSQIDKVVRERIESSLLLSQIADLPDEDDQTVFQVRE